MKNVSKMASELGMQFLAYLDAEWRFGSLTIDGGCTLCGRKTLTRGVPSSTDWDLESSNYSRHTRTVSFRAVKMYQVAGRKIPLCIPCKQGLTIFRGSGTDGLLREAEWLARRLMKQSATIQR